MTDLCPTCGSGDRAVRWHMHNGEPWHEPMDALHEVKAAMTCYDPWHAPAQPDLHADVAFGAASLLDHLRGIPVQTDPYILTGTIAFVRDGEAQGVVNLLNEVAALESTVERQRATIARLERIEKAARAFGPCTSPEWATVTFLREDVERMRAALTRKEAEHE